jgi:hypothetical protein
VSLRRPPRWHRRRRVPLLSDGGVGCDGLGRPRPGRTVIPASIHLYLMWPPRGEHAIPEACSCGCSLCPLGWLWTIGLTRPERRDRRGGAARGQRRSRITGSRWTARFGGTTGSGGSARPAWPSWTSRRPGWCQDTGHPFGVLGRLMFSGMRGGRGACHLVLRRASPPRKRALRDLSVLHAAASQQRSGRRDTRQAVGAVTVQASIQARRLSGVRNSCLLCPR